MNGKQIFAGAMAVICLLFALGVLPQSTLAVWVVLTAVWLFLAV